AIDAALFDTRPCGHWVLLVVVGLVAGNGLLDILKCQKQLLGIELLRTPAELRTLQLAQEMPQAINLRQRLVALRDRGVTLRMRRRDQCMQRFNVGRKLRRNLAHARTESDSRAVVISPSADDSKGRSAHDVAVGRATSRACSRDQSIPSTSAASCDAVSRITPSLIGGHRNAPCSSRFQNST